MKKLKQLKYALISLLIFLIGWNSFYVKKLSEKNKTGLTAFDAKAFAQKIWEEQLPQKFDSALSIQDFLAKTNDKNPATLLRYTNSLSIGNIRHAILSAEGSVTKLSEDGFLLEINRGGSILKLPVELEYVYGKPQYHLTRSRVATNEKRVERRTKFADGCSSRNEHGSFST